MLLHLEHLFDGFLDGCQNGLIELAWTDGKDGRLRHAAIFGTDQLDEIIEKAVTENRKPGQNVYIGIALRKPETPPFGRCNDEDFLALTAFYADLDDEGTAEAAKPRYKEAPPTAVVVTGRHPHLRAQLLWRQETPETNPEICRQQNLAIAVALGGDRTVVNPSRVLRLYRRTRSSKGQTLPARRRQGSGSGGDFSYLRREVAGVCLRHLLCTRPDQTLRTPLC
jgi:hypothetical protein